jgi:hypothetical protein
VSKKDFFSFAGKKKERESRFQKGSIDRIDLEAQSSEIIELEGLGPESKRVIESRCATQPYLRLLRLDLELPSSYT